MAVKYLESLHSHTAGPQTRPRDWIPAGQLYNLQDESELQQDSIEVSMLGLETSRMAGKSQGRIWGPAG